MRHFKPLMLALLAAGLLVAAGYAQEDDSAAKTREQLTTVGPPPQELIDAVDEALRWIKGDDSEQALRQLRRAQTLARNMIRVYPAHPDWAVRKVQQINCGLSAAADYVLRGLEDHKLQAMRAVRSAQSAIRAIELHYELYGPAADHQRPCGSAIVFHPV